MKPERSTVQLSMPLDVFKQIESKLVQPQVHDGNTGLHFLYVHDLVLQLFELCLAVFKVALLFWVNRVIVAGGGHNRRFHSRLDASFELEVFVEVDVRPEIHELDAGVAAADTVNTPKPLNDTDRIPMDIVVDAVVA